MIEAIDVHTHIFAPGWPDFAARFGGDRWPRLDGDPASGCKLYLGSTFNRNLGPNAFDPARRIDFSSGVFLGGPKHVCRLGLDSVRRRERPHRLRRGARPRDPFTPDARRRDPPLVTSSAK